VPVTVYRPVSAVDPATGCPVTAMQPCTTYTWQAQRVPFVYHRARWGILPTTVPVAAAAMPAQACCPQTGVPATTYSVPAAGAGCSTCGVPATVTAPSPYYAPPGGMQYTPAPAVPGASGLPADAAPTLRQRPVEPNGQEPQVRIYRVDPNLPADPNNGNSNGMINGLNGSGTRTDPMNRVMPNSHKAPAAPHDLRPLPDPDANKDGFDGNRAPPLLDPRDKTAARSAVFRGQYAPIVWPVKQAAADGEVPAPTAAPEWDDRGWRQLSR
jgi:hypothetical protein